MESSTEKRFPDLFLSISPISEKLNTTPRGLLSILGLLEATLPLVLLGCLYRPAIHRAHALAMLCKWYQPLDCHVHLQPEILPHLQLWIQKNNGMSEVQMHQPQAVLMVYTDKSLEG
jgi:hypothetical protein